MKRPAVHARRGIALVITLIMLSVVTITAVAFLAVSRRDRNATISTGEQTDVRFLADAALNRARAEVAAGISAAGNRFAYNFLVSTNYQNPLANPKNSYLATAKEDFLTNVNYLNTSDPKNPQPYDLTTGSGRDLYRRMLANLYYSPRPPVFVKTNYNPNFPTDFRFYLDLNRNGRFESNGVVQARDASGKTNGYSAEQMVGDPEWIGILQHPDLPHSGTNLFVGRIAYVVTPAGRNLDWNYIHNSVKIAHGLDDSTGTGRSAFLRNEGVGSWELNLAGFLSDLNTNCWPKIYPGNGYQYRTNLNQPSLGLAYDDASSLLRYRRSAPSSILASSEAFFDREAGGGGLAFGTTFARDGVDMYSDGPFAATVHDVRYNTVDNDPPAKPWPGSDFTNSIIDPAQFFDPSLESTGGFANRIRGIGYSTSTNSTYDNYTFYRMLGQLGSDTADARFESGLHPAYVTPANPYGFYRRAKLNLNYAMDNPNGDQPANARVTFADGLHAWAPLQWFTNAANRVLLTEFTNGLPFWATDSLGNSTVSRGLAILGPVDYRTNFVVGSRKYNLSVHTNYVYNPQVHRLLQLAANIFDYTTNRFLISTSAPGSPSVFRPLFYREKATPDAIRLGGYVEVNGWSDDYLKNWIDPWNTNLLKTSFPLTANNEFPAPKTNAAGPKIYGIPWVIGAKKGLPSFHEAFWQSAIQVTRRMMFSRPSPQIVMSTSESPFSGGNGKGFETLVQYRLRITNSVAVDGYYAYTNPFPHAVRIYAINQHKFAIRSDLTPTNQFIFTNQTSFGGAPVTVAANKWLPLTYQTVINSANSNSLVYDIIYDPVIGRVFPGSTDYNGHFVQANRTMSPLNVYVTNSLVFAITDQSSGRILDFVTLQSSMVETNVFRYLGETTAGALGPVPIAGVGNNGGLTAAGLWATNRIAIYGTAGISNQFRVAVKRSEPPGGQWVSALGLGDPQDLPKSAAGLNYFLYHTTSDQLDKATKAALDLATTIQSGFNPSATVYLTDRRMANDPLVHYTMDDLVPGYSVYGEPGGYAEIEIAGIRRTPKNGKPFTLDAKVTTNQVGLPRKILTASAPWGTNANYGYFTPPRPDDAASTAYDMAFKDPGITRADDWFFPTGRFTKFSNIGQLGRVHRGTPWQSVYLKSATNVIGSAVGRVDGAKGWAAWAGNPETYPIKDRNLFDLFTTALNDNGARGLLGVNQTNIASWSALLSGVPLLENSQDRATTRLSFIEPASPSLTQILMGYTNSVTREVVSGVFKTATNSLVAPGGYFPNLGSILAVPTLSDKSPYLNIPTKSTDWNKTLNLTDEVIERLPQQVLSLVKSDEPRVVVYSYAQTLKPAPNSLVTAPGAFYGLCTNYQVTGEYATKSVLRFDGPPADLKAVVEDARVLYQSN